jgi:DNA-binding MarR family transcriptional regulator
VEPLTDAEAELWTAWTAAAETLTQVSADVAAATGLSEPDVTVLMCLHRAPGARLRQSEIAARTGWHRSRLSHHLRRMAERGLVNRTEVPGGVEVGLTTMGRAATVRARPVQADAVRRHLLDPLASRDRDRLLSILRRLTGPGS